MPDEGLPPPLAFVDTETTGLDRTGRHQIWEVALVVRRWERDATGSLFTDEEESHWFLPVDLGRADPVALRIGRFHERHPRGYDFDWRASDDDGRHVSEPAAFAEDFADRTRGCHLVGAVTSFDEERLWRLLTENGACPEWHYHLVCVENVAYGYLLGREKNAMALPWKSHPLTEAVGCPKDMEGEHTAMGDVRWAIATWDAMHEDSQPWSPEPA